MPTVIVKDVPLGTRRFIINCDCKMSQKHRAFVNKVIGVEQRHKTPGVYVSEHVDSINGRYILYWAQEWLQLTFSDFSNTLSKFSILVQ